MKVIVKNLNAENKMQKLNADNLSLMLLNVLRLLKIRVQKMKIQETATFLLQFFYFMHY